MEIKIKTYSPFKALHFSQDLCKFADWAKICFGILQERWQFTLPPTLIVRPLLTKLGASGNCGQVSYYSDGTYHLAVNLLHARESHDEGLSTVIHETCHIADHRMRDDFGHSCQFREMLAYCQMPEHLKLFERR